MPAVEQPVFRFDPDRVATFEAAGWRAYYDRRWIKLLRLTWGLCREQFGIPFPQSILAAYHVTRGALAWAPVDHDDAQVLAFYRRFYRIARRYSGLTFDPDRVAELEMRYWDDHRRLVGVDDKREFLATLIALHAALFGLSPEEARPSAEYRLRAATTVDRITGGRSTDIAADWAAIEADLRRCYRSIDRRLRQRESPAAN